MSEAHRLVVDRFEGDLVVVEVDGEQMLDVPRWLLPSSVEEGAVLILSVSDDTGRQRVWTVVHDVAATESARSETRERLRRLRERDPGGDVIL